MTSSHIRLTNIKDIEYVTIITPVVRILDDQPMFPEENDASVKLIEDQRIVVLVAEKFECGPALLKCLYDHDHRLMVEFGYNLRISVIRTVRVL